MDGGYKETDPPLHNQDVLNDDADIQMGVISNEMSVVNEGGLPTVNGGERAETSLGGIKKSLKESKMAIHNDAVNDFYKSIGYEPSIRDYNDFVLKEDGQLVFIKDGNKFILYNVKENFKLYLL